MSVRGSLDPGRVVRLMRTAFLTLGPEGGAGPRYRVYQFVPQLEAAGIRCAVMPAVRPGAMRRLYATGTRAGNAGYQAVELARRSAQLLAVRRFDVVVVQKALLTVGIRGFDAVGAVLPRRLVVDVDDAVHLGPPHRLPTWLRLLGDPAQPARLLARADQVIAGSETLAEALRPLNPRVAVVPTSLDTDRFVPAPCRPERTPVIGWMGSCSTAPYLEALVGALRRLARRERFVLRVVGGPAPPLDGVAVEERPWSLEGEVAELQGFDVGIMPLPDTPWAAGKCGLKAIQYMAVGIPTVCSPVGAGGEVVRDGREGFLASAPSEWEEALGALLADPGLRMRMGAAGRARAEERYSVRTNAPRLVETLWRAAA